MQRDGDEAVGPYSASFAKRVSFFFALALCETADPVYVQESTIRPHIDSSGYQACVEIL